MAIPSPYSNGARAFESANGLVKELSWLVSPPEVCLRVSDLLQSETSSARDFEKVIGQDPNLTARLLKLVNSSFFSFSARIDTVSRAVAIIGLRELQQLVLAISAVKAFSRIDASLINVSTFWRHSVYCGVISQALAKRCRVLHPERLFVAGLLHDVGSLLLYHRIPELCRELLVTADGDEEALHRAELDELGFTHAEIGGLLMDLWQLPNPLQEAVRFHHTPGEAGAGRTEAALVHLANVLSNRCQAGSYCATATTEWNADPTVWQTLPVQPDDVDEAAVVNHARVQFTEMVGVFGLRDAK